MRHFTQGRALVIGVGTYKDSRRNAPIASTDASSCFEALVDPDGASYARSEVELLLDAEATREGFSKAFERLADRCTKDNVVFISITSHGALGDDGLYYLATNDTQFTTEGEERIKAKTGFSVADLARALCAIRSCRVLVVINACFAGHLGPRLIQGQVNPDRLIALTDDASKTILATGEGRAIISASKPDQRSFYDTKKDHSYFGQALIQALKGGPESEHCGYIGLYELYTTIHRQVRSATLRANQAQDPTLTLVQGVGPFPIAAYPHSTISDGHISQQVPRDAVVNELPASTIITHVDRQYNLRDIWSLTVQPGDLPNIRGAIEERAKLKRWEDLVDQLCTIRLDPSHDKVQTAYDSVLRASDPLPSRTSGPGFMQALIRQLNDLSPLNHLPPLIEFVAALAHYHPQSRPLVQQWLTASYGIWETSEDIVAKRRIQAENSSLLIAIIGKSPKYRLRSWLWRTKGDPEILHESKDHSPESLRKELSQICRRAEAKVPNPNRLCVEFFLPRSLLNEPVHTWPLTTVSIFDDDEDAGSDLQSIYMRYQVLIRSTERSMQPAATPEIEEYLTALRKRWRDRWNRLHTGDGIVVRATHQSDYHQRIAAALVPSGQALCYAETITPPDDFDLVRQVMMRLIDAGVPAGIWVSTHVERVLSVYEQIALMVEKPLNQLPSTHLTLDTHLKQAVVLFWDNPDRVPEETYFQA